MEIKRLNQRPNIDQNNKLNKKYIQFEKLLSELKKKELTSEVVSAINNNIDHVNSMTEAENELGKKLRRAQSIILKLIEKEHKLVTINHYRNIWLALGMSVFGIPLGVAFGASLGNMGFIGIGFPIGMVIGIAVGTSLDKKASVNGKQLDLEIKY